MRTRQERGFTLVELMVVIVILGTLIALVGPNVYNALFKANVGAAEAQMAAFGDAIDRYRMDNKKLPPSLDDLTQTDSRNPYPYLNAASIPADPWGNPYDYKVLDSKTYEIQCFGEDGLADTEDDLFYPKRDK